MAEQTMPAAEANEAVEANSYELAFHVLPTVAEGEVANVFDTIKAHITDNGGTIDTEEAPARIELAYEIEKYLEGKYRRFKSAYFGWVRFTADPAVIATLTEEIDGDQNILRHLLIKLSKMEEEHPFYYHQALAEEAQVANVDVEAALDSADGETATAEAPSAATTEEPEKEATEAAETTEETDAAADSEETTDDDAKA